MSRNVDAWVPLNTQPGGRNSHTDSYLTAVARLAPGVGLERARAALEIVRARWEEEHGEPYDWRTVRLEPLTRDVTGDARVMLWILMGAAGLVLLMACVNVANVFLARSIAGTRDLAVRSALGASRGRLVRQQLIEGVLVAVAGGVVGSAVAFWGVRLLLELGPASLPRSEEIGFDPWLLVFALATTILTVLLFGIFPAWNAARIDPNTALRDGTRGNTGGRAGSRVRDGIVVLQVALAIVLLIGAGVLMRSFSTLQRVDLGIDPARVGTFEIHLPGVRYTEPEAVPVSTNRSSSVLRPAPESTRSGRHPGCPATGPITSGDTSTSMRTARRRGPMRRYASSMATTSVPSGSAFGPAARSSEATARTLRSWR